MQGNFQRRFPAVRARHGKRLPQFQGETVTGDGDGNVPNFTSPITVTVVQTRQPSPPPVASITPTVTVFVPPPTPSPASDSTSESTSGSSLLPPSTPLPSSSLSRGTLQPTTSVLSASSTSTVVRPTPSASVTVNNDGTKNDMAQSNTSASHGIPTGSIIGIVVAVVLVLIAAVVFLIRKRSVRDRLKARGNWPNKGISGPSFLWIEPGEKPSITPYPVASGRNRGGETSPSSTFVTAQTPASSYAPSSLPYTPPPALPRPPPAQGTQPSSNPGSGPSASSALGLTVPAALVPGRAALAPSAYSSPPAPGGYASFPESATVRSTFIPTLPDELSISTGEVVRVMSVYDDGWALCLNARQEVGMVPLECLDQGGASQAQQEGREYRGLNRASSLAASPNPYGGMARY